MEPVPKSRILYHSDLPYPPVRVKQRNPVYAKDMLDNLGGANSEMSAVSLYFYDFLVTAENREISEAFRQISIVEMHHMEIFGTLARQLGEDPRLWTQCGVQKRYWTPGYHRYPLSLGRLLSYAMQEERAAIKKYRKQAHRITDENIVENLQRIILDEQLHIQILEKLCYRFVGDT